MIFLINIKMEKIFSFFSEILEKYKNDTFTRINVMDETLDTKQKKPFNCKKKNEIK